MTQESSPSGIGWATFAEQLRRYRQRVGLTQETLAERVGLAVATIGALERGVHRHPYPHTRLILAEGLELEGAERAFFIAPPAVEPEMAVPPPAATTNLPPPRSPIIGRAGEIATLCELMGSDSVRLVTLTGVGGAGKTRLALEVARAMETEFSGGVWLVQLAPVADAALLPQALGNALGLQDALGVSLLESVLHHLGQQSGLLVLDNCEHLIEACAALVEQLLTSCPALSILATSREPLQVQGERQWRVPLLAVPDLDNGAVPPNVVDLVRYPSIELFLARAGAAVSTFQMTPENAPDIARICFRLAGLPLAVELAAARVKVLAPAQILTRLDDTLRLLTKGSPAAPTRQQSLRAMLDWSYELLGEDEKATFARLAVFAGSFDLDAAEAVCAVRSLPAEDILDLLALLVDKSLVLIEEDGNSMVARYRLLEPVRQYALSYLNASAEGESARSRHASHYLALAERAAPELRGPGQLDWLDRLESERDNLRAALLWAEATGDATLGLRLAVALAPFWEGHGHLSEGKRWLAALLALPAAGAVPISLRARALLAGGRLAQWRAELEPAAELLERCLDLARSLDDQTVVAEALVHLGAVRRHQGAFGESAQLLEKSLALYRTANDSTGCALALVTLGVTVRDQDAPRSVGLIEEALARFQRAGDLRWIAIAQSMLATSRQLLGDASGAMECVLAGLAGHRATGDRAFGFFGMQVLAQSLAAVNQPLRAARILGTAAGLSETVGIQIAPADQQEYRQIVDSVRGQLGSADFEAAWAAGKSMTLDQALAALVE